MELKEMREHIDQIDAKLLRLFQERMELSKQVARYKEERQLPVFHAEREQEILDKIAKESGELSPYAVSFFRELMSLSKEFQNRLIDDIRCENRKNLLCGLIGEKLGHSYSKEIHEQMGCKRYEMLELSKEEILPLLKSETYQGFNVTIPYKQVVMEFCKELSEEAKEVGSVNTMVKLPEGGYKGYNTDVDGFVYLAKKAKLSFEGAKVLVFGNGGAAKAVIYASKKMGAQEVVVVSRRGPVYYEDIMKHYDATILVNATPVGMYPEVLGQIVDLKPFSSCIGVIDLIYNPCNTQLLQQARKLNLKYINGMSMLVAQAFRAEELFFRQKMNEGIIGKVEKRIAFSQINLVLVGMPGSGKSAIGRSLGRMMNRKVIDLDVEIEKCQRKAIPAIFEEVGEPGFREIETEVLKAVCKEKGVILVTGGGTVLSKENKVLIRSNAVVYHVERDISQLARKGRPLSKKGQMNQMYKERISHYKEVRDAVCYNRSNIDAAAGKIYKEFLKRLER